MVHMPLDGNFAPVQKLYAPHFVHWLYSKLLMADAIGNKGIMF